MAVAGVVLDCVSVVLVREILDDCDVDVFDVDVFDVVVSDVEYVEVSV